MLQDATRLTWVSWMRALLERMPMITAKLKMMIQIQTMRQRQRLRCWILSATSLAN